MTSKVKVNTVETESGSTLTLGKSGDTVTLASGASQSGFGRTGTVDWQTTPKTANFTAVNGEGYFCNTTSSAFTMTMPSGSAGAIVSIQDYNKTFDTNALTIAPASGEKINGGLAGGNLIINTEGQGLTFVYVDSTVGWKSIHENEFTGSGSNFIVASGGTETTCGDYKIHTFTSPGTFTVSQIATTCAPTNNVLSYLVVAGGGGGGARNPGNANAGGGAGGFREYKGPADCYTASPLNGNPGGTSVTVTAQAYPITVGAGGAGGSPVGPTGVPGTDGSNSVFSTITSTGGGGGGDGTTLIDGRPGGSGGGGGGGGNGTSSRASGGTGNTPPVSPSQGNNGGQGIGPSTPSGLSPDSNAGGGGGATAVGGIASNSPATGGDGGAGATTSISGSSTSYAGGGGAGGRPGCGAGDGGTGGGGDGGNGPSPRSATSGTANTGGGGGGGGAASPAADAEPGDGGSGIVIIRYKFQ